MISTKRLKSLDAFRGLTVASMILVNNPGSWEHVYPPLLHAPWNGCTPTDLIFPFFIFSVGMSIHFAYKESRNGEIFNNLFIKILKRSVLIFLIGVFISLFPTFNIETVRIPGVLQRISIVFFLCAILYLKTSWRTQLLVFISLLGFYYLLLTFVPVPGIGPANLEPTTNLAAWLDNLLLRNHLWGQTKTWDPEGILSTLPAIATGISGLLTGLLVSHFTYAPSRLKGMLLWAALLTLCGVLWSYSFPLNKSLWTSSYVLFTSGIAVLAFSFFYWIIEVMHFEKWSLPFRWYGVNALFVFVASGLLAKILFRIKITNSAGIKTSVWSSLYDSLFQSWLSPLNASLGFACMWVGIFGIILFVLYRKNIIIKL